MGLFIVPSVWVVRSGPALKRWGDPYTGTAVIFRSGSTAHIEAWSGAPPSTRQRRSIVAELRQAGITHVHWERRRADGTVHYVSRRIAGRGR